MVSRKTENRQARRGYSPTSPGRGVRLNERGQREYPERTPAQKRAEQAAARREVAADRRRQRERERAARAAGTGTDAPTPRKRTPEPPAERPVAKKRARAGVRRTQGAQGAQGGGTPATTQRAAPAKKAAPAPRKAAAPAKAAGRTVRKNPGTTVEPRKRTPIKRTGNRGNAR